MTLAELLVNRFRADLRHRGAAYVEAERISLVRVTPENIFGLVNDGAEFQTQLRYQPDDISLFCTCDQFARQKACKHLWATVLASDSGGYVSPSIRPGRLAPFIAPTLHRPVPVSDIEAEGESWDEVSDSKRKRQRARKPAEKPADLRPWEKRLLELRQEMVGTPDGRRKSEPSEREIWYEVDLSASGEAGQLVIQASQRQRRAGGQWGKIKPLKIRPGELSQIEHEDDRTFLSYLAGAIPERNNWTTQQSEMKSSAHRYYVPFELAQRVLPDICRTGRLRILGTGDSGGQTLLWDDADPWQLTIRVRRDTEQDGWKVAGLLTRGDEALELDDVPLVVPGGFVITTDAIGVLQDFGAPEWIPMLAPGPMHIPARDEEDFVDRLLDIPSLPRLELPKELQLEEVRARPKPMLRISSPPMKRWRNDTLSAEVLFDYLGTTIPGGSARWAIVQRDENRCIIRDTEFENECWETLRQCGFRRRLADLRTHVSAEIPRSELGRGVRTLVDAGWNVFADGSQVRQAGQMRFRVASDIDWFDVHADIDFEGRSVAFPELLRAVERGDSTVRLDDGSLGIVPEEWLEQIGMISGLGTVLDDNLRFSNSQAALLDALLAAQDTVEVDEAFAEARERFRSFSGIDDVTVPESFQGELRPYQREGLAWLAFLNRFGFGGCLADDMGLGKTVQFLAMLLRERQDRPDAAPSLVVVPRSLMFNWVSECARFAPQLKVLEYSGLDRDGLRDQFSSHHLILTTYGTVRRDVSLLKDVEFDYIVLDEAQTIKNPASQIARASRLLRARHRLALSGTPIENNAGDLWSIFEFLNPGMLGRSSVFRSHIADPDNREARTLVAKGIRPFILRRTKSQVAAELPERLEETIYCDMQDEQRHLYDELRLHYRESLLGLVEEQGLGKSKMHVLEALLRLRQAACHPAMLNRGDDAEAYAKLEYLIPHLQELISEGHKALVFSQFTSMLSIVRSHLDQAGVSYEYLDGKTRDRRRRVNRFQNEDECRVFLISLKAGGLGLNLTAADYVFLLDPWWNPAVEAQAIDRAHRVGQTRTVFAYRLICRDTVEEKIAQLQQQKRELADAILDGDQSASVLKDLSAEDLELLLS